MKLSYDAEIIKKINKKSYRVIDYGTDKLAVVWIEQEKVKFGYLSKRYFQRYGADVVLTCRLGTRRFWFQSGNIAYTMNNNFLEFIETVAESPMVLNEFPLLDPEKDFESIQS